MCEWSLGDSPANPPRVRPQALASSARARQPPRRTCNSCQAPRRINGQWLLPMRSRSAPWTIWASSAPTSLLASHPRRPDPTHSRTRPPAAPRALQASHTALAGLGDTSQSDSRRLHYFQLNGPWYYDVPCTRQSTEDLVTPVLFVLVHWAALRNGNHSSR